MDRQRLLIRSLNSFSGMLVSVEFSNKQSGPWTVFLLLCLNAEASNKHFGPGQ